MRLSKPHLEHFNREGYVVVERVLSDLDFVPLIREYETFIDIHAKGLHDRGALSDLYATEPFERRLARITEETTDIYATMDIMMFRGEALFAFLKHPKLMTLIEGILGPEIICSPIQHLRPKLPAALKYRGPLEGEAREKAEQTLAGYIGEHVAPWHQDAQVHLDEADPSFILTVWIPLCDATTENGCMEIVPRIHTRRMVYWHEGFGITEEQVPERTSAIPVPMKKGSVLLMHKFIPHRSTPNRTDGIRWSMDLRYQKTGKPTGRPHYPHFVAHSRRSPDSVMRDYPLWCNQWVEALDRVKKTGWPSREYRPVEPAEMKCDE